MKVLAIDGNSILNRAFYGIKMLTTKSGQYTNAVFGFINILFKLLENEQPDAVCVAFDLKAPTFRHQKYEGYKAGRKPMPEELRSQLPLIKEWLTLAGYSVLEKEGYEADDILGTLSHLCEQANSECVIATGDRDAFQLISKSTKVLLSSTKAGQAEVVCYDEAALFEKYGLTPPQMIELKAIMGDSSDKIPGVAGIGEKGATDLIKQFGTLDNIYENINSENIKEGVRNKLIAGRDSAYLSRWLGTICKTVPIESDLNLYKIKEKSERLAAFMTKLELFKQLKYLSLTPAAVKEEIDSQEVNIVSPNTFAAEDVLDIYCDLEKSEVVLLSKNTAALFKENDLFLLQTKITKEAKKRVYDSKNFYKFAKETGINTENVVFDTVLAAYLANPSSNDYSLDRLFGEYANKKMAAQTEEETLKIALQLPAVNDSLHDYLEQNEQLPLLNEIELPLAEVLADMETVGVYVDKNGIAEMGEELGERIEKLQTEIYLSVGWEFNLNSPKQLGEALFERLKLPAKKKTSRGYSTNAEVLAELKDYHPAVALLLEYRQLAKLKSTYCDGLLAVIDSDGRVRSTFNQTETRTGRISSLEPNLQNIPVRSHEGRKIRKFFLAKEGYTLVDADYSQIELRVLAALANEENMKAAFLHGVDIHTLTASEVFNMPKELISDELRGRAKAVNFGIIYGIGAFSLAKDIGVTRKEADNYIKSYLAAYKGVDLYMQNVLNAAKENGYVKTIFGRRRYLPELNNSNHMIRAFGERVARNAPIQGSAADIIKIAMIKVYSRIKRENLNAKLILQVHDELIVECKEEIKDYVCQMVKEEMENAVDLQVKMRADVGFGKSWYDAKG